MSDVERRKLLKAIGASGLSTGLAGCAGMVLPDRFAAAPYGLTADAAHEAGYTVAKHRTDSAERSVPLAGDVTIIKELLVVVGKKRPYIWVKLEWVVCKEYRCPWSLWLTKYLDWQHHEKWLLVSSPRSVLPGDDRWDPVQQWTASFVENEVNPAVQQVIGGATCP